MSDLLDQAMAVGVLALETLVENGASAAYRLLVHCYGLLITLQMGAARRAPGMFYMPLPHYITDAMVPEWGQGYWETDADIDPEPGEEWDAAFNATQDLMKHRR